MAGKENDDVAGGGGEALPENPEAEQVGKNIPDHENVVRAICTPHHVNEKKGTLKRGAFRQKVPTRGVSVYRTLILSSRDCKDRGKALSNQNKTYVGLACVQAGEVRAAQALLEDTREEMFYGHADVFVMTAAEGYAFEEGEPLPPEVSEMWDARVDAILKATKFYLDPQPDSDQWGGPELAAA